MQKNLNYHCENIDKNCHCKKRTFINTAIYFISSRNSMHTYSREKWYCLQWKNIVFFSLVMNTIYIFFTVASRGYFQNLGLNFFECTVRVWHYATDACTSNIATYVTLRRHFWAHVTLICTLRQSEVASSDFLKRKCFFIHSLKWHFKSFSRCKLRYNQYYTHLTRYAKYY